MIRTILCAVDISDNNSDRNVLVQAARMAEMDNAQLDVVTVVPDYGVGVVSGFFNKEHQKKAIDEAKVRLNQIVTEVIGAERNAKVRHIVAMGKAYEEIIRLADKDKADLIVIGAHGADLADFLLGPNAARVVRHSSASVYVVRDS